MSGLFFLVIHMYPSILHKSCGFVIHIVEESQSQLLDLNPVVGPGPLYSFLFRKILKTPNIFSVVYLPISAPRLH